jgi:hypothetical protein
MGFATPSGQGSTRASVSPEPGCGYCRCRRARAAGLMLLLHPNTMDQRHSRSRSIGDQKDDREVDEHGEQVLDDRSKGSAAESGVPAKAMKRPREDHRYQRCDGTCG